MSWPQVHGKKSGDWTPNLANPTMQAIDPFGLRAQLGLSTATMLAPGSGLMRRSFWGFLANGFDLHRWGRDAMRTAFTGES